VALFQKMTCILRHPMSLRHPVLVEVKYICIHVYVCVCTYVHVWAIVFMCAAEYIQSRHGYSIQVEVGSYFGQKAHGYNDRSFTSIVRQRPSLIRRHLLAGIRVGCVCLCAAVCCSVLQRVAVSSDNGPLSFAVIPYGVATVSRIDKIIGFFCTQAL